MARYRTGRKLAAAAVAVAGLTSLGANDAAWAFDASVRSASALLGTCNVFLEVISVPFNPQDVRVRLGRGFTGGSAYFPLGRQIPNAGPSITVADIQTCGLTNVTNLVQNGADFATSDLDDYMGFSFRATDTTDGKTYDYEYALQGLTNTQFVTTKVLYTSPAPPPTTPTPTPTPTTPTVSPSLAIISSLQSERMNQLAQRQPDIAALLEGPGGTHVSMNGASAAGGIDASFVAGPIWGQVTTSWSNADRVKSHYVLGSFGAHAQLSPGFAVGAMLEADHINQDDPTFRAKGNGWLAGPYMIARLPEHELQFDARALWGHSSNDTLPARTYTDSFDGTRSLIQIRASTRLDWGRFELRPRVSYSHVRETSDAFTDHLGIAVPRVKSAIDEGTLGLSVSRSFDMATGTLKLTGAVDGIWTNTTEGIDAAYENGRAQLTLGLSYDMAEYGTFSAGIFGDGIAQDGYEGRGLTLAYNLTF